MKTTLIKKSEKIKSSIKGTSEKSKEAIREIIDSNTRYIGSALESNKKIVDSIKEKLVDQEIEDSVTNTLRTSFGQSIDLAGAALDSIINSYIRQMELNVDFNTRLVDAVNESKNENSEKVLSLIHDNFETSRELTISNAKEIFDFYTKHTNLAVNFNEKFGENITVQLEFLYTAQSKELNKFTEWASEWWKQEDK